MKKGADLILSQNEEGTKAGHLISEDRPCATFHFKAFKKFETVSLSGLLRH